MGGETAVEWQTLCKKEMTTTARRGKLDTLQVLRCLALLGVMSTHTGYQFPYRIYAGAWGVSVFLVLSGFTMIYSYYGQGRISEVSVGRSIAFSYNKVKRLYPLHAVATLIMFAGSFVNGTNIFSMRMAVTRLVLNLLLIQEYFPFQDQSICIVSWYLCVVVLSYFVFPWILRWMENSWSGRKAVLMIAVSVVLMAVIGWMGAFLVKVLDAPLSTAGNVWGYDQQWFTYKFPIFRLLDIYIGYNLGYIYLQVEHRGSERTYTIVEAFAIAATIAVMAICYCAGDTQLVGDVGIDPWWAYCLIQVVSSMALIYTFAIGRGRISRALAGVRPILYVARLSPYMFIMHYCVFWGIYVATVLTRNLPGLSWIAAMGDTHLEAMKVFIGIPLTIVGSEIWIRLDRWVRERAPVKA